MTDRIAAAELLERTRDRLTDDAWTQGAIARRIDDSPTSGADPAAVRYCLAGALSAECYAASDGPEDVQGYDDLWLVAMRALRRELDAPADARNAAAIAITNYNDSPQRRAADVRELCDRAAAALRRSEQ